MIQNRNTSIEIYEKLKADGRLSHKRLDVVFFIAKNGPTYQRQAHKNLTRFNGSNSSTYMSRFGELEKMGVIEIVGKGVDEDTGNTVNLYDLTGRMPTIVKELTNKVKIERLKDAYNLLLRGLKACEYHKENAEMIQRLVVGYKKSAQQALNGEGK